MKGATCFILALIGHFALGTAQICPPPEVLLPCNCTESTKTILCKGVRGRLNLKQVFDNAASFINDDIVFTKLAIQDNNQILELEEGAIQHLRFEEIDISSNENLVYISPLAFNASRNVTKKLELGGNYIGNEARYQSDIFDLINSFENLVTLRIANNRLSSIPANAFQNLKSLTEVDLQSNIISSIGSRAFSQLTNLTRLTLSYNSMPSEGLPEDAFEDISSAVYFDVTYNYEMIFVEQNSFQLLLDRVWRLEIGGKNCSPNGCSYRRLHCDERADWICADQERYEEKLIGFMCIVEQPGIGNLWQYCAAKGNGTLH